jgi:peroxiredoxin
MLEVGEQAPDARVWIGPSEPVSLHDLHAEGTILVLFYLFDWSST